MARKKREKTPAVHPSAQQAHIIGAGEVLQQPVTETVESNFMPYAMSVILSRAIPAIDGFKPAHRKILYTMYKMGLLTGARSKSANIVGRTMQLNPHGDAAIYETMVLLSRGYEKLLHPWVDSKGNFGKTYSRDMQWAAARYTEAKLEELAKELFKDIDKDTVDFVDNYDSTLQEPTLLPVRFPSVLVNLNTGIAVGMASSICSFALAEVCRATIALAKDAMHDVLDLMPAPDFVGGAQILYDRAQFEEIYRTGRGSFKMRAKYRFDPANHCIDVYEIPPTTTAEAIIDKVVERVKTGAVREISDIRDETDRSGLKITIDLKRGVDPDALMLRLFKHTSLEDSFACNFNVLVQGSPRVLGVRALLLEWIGFRVGCIRRRLQFDLQKALRALHLLEGLAKILLDIDQAIRVIRETEDEADVVPNLMIAFGIDEVQADYVAEIKLRHLNRAYILKRTAEMDALRQEIATLQADLASDENVKRIMIDELQEVIAKHEKPRRSEIVHAADLPQEIAAPVVEDYPVTVFMTRQGYFKKIVPASLRMNDQQKCKDGDAVVQRIDCSNAAHLLFFSNQCQVYKATAAEFEDGKASQMGDFLASKLEMEPNELPVFLVVTSDYAGFLLFAFANGKCAKVPLASYATKVNRKKLVNAYANTAPLVAALHLLEDCECVICASTGRTLLFHTGALPLKVSKNTQGLGVMTLRAGSTVQNLFVYSEGELPSPARFRTKNLPAAGVIPPTDAAQLRVF